MLLPLVAQCLRSLTSKQQESNQMPDKSLSELDVKYVLPFYSFLDQGLRR